MERLLHHVSMFKWVATDFLTLRLSAGKGYRSPHALAEYNYLMASGRRLIIDQPLKQEAAWNYGANMAFNIPLFNKNLKLNAEYYYTHFTNQTVIDYDSNPLELHIDNLNGKSYSHTFQIEHLILCFAASNSQLLIATIL